MTMYNVYFVFAMIHDGNMNLRVNILDFVDNFAQRDHNDDYNLSDYCLL